MTTTSGSPSADPRQRDFDKVLSHDSYTGLRAILESLSNDRQKLFDAVTNANSFEDLLGKLGYRMTLTRQIHVQDAFSRMGPAGGIKAVLPYYDIPTQSSLPMLVHFNSTVTITPESAAFFGKMLAALRQQSAEVREPV